jgi:hypothetical protein
MHGDWHGDEQIVPFAPEQGMRLHVDGDEQVPRGSTVPPRMTLPGTRMRPPSATPGGTFRVSGSVRISICCLPHVGQRVCRCPGRRNVHGLENTIWPRTDLTRPTPRQCAHRVSATLRRPRLLAQIGSAPAGHRHNRLPAAHRVLEAHRDRLVQVGAALCVLFLAPRLRWCSTSANKSPKVAPSR